MANVKISALPAASALTGSELVPVVQGGVTSQTTVSAIAAKAAGSAYPLNIVQWFPWQSGTSNIATTSVVFPQAAAASGNTLFFLLALDGSQTFTVPTGWTVDFNQAATNYARLLLMHKASAGDTSVTLAYPTASSFSGLFFEVSGNHALDQSSLAAYNLYSSSAGICLPYLPAITPSAGSAVFGAYAWVSTTGGYDQTGRTPPSSPNWKTDYVQAHSSVAGRGLLFSQYMAAAPGSLLINPPAAFAPGWSYYSAGGLAYGTFSIL